MLARPQRLMKAGAPVSPLILPLSISSPPSSPGSGSPGRVRCPSPQRGAPPPREQTHRHLWRTRPRQVPPPPSSWEPPQAPGGAGVGTRFLSTQCVLGLCQGDENRHQKILGRPDLHTENREWRSEQGALGLAPSPRVQTPCRGLSLRQATWPAGVQGYTASLWDTRGIVVLIWNHEWEIRECLLVLGSNGNRP